jgi:hypothetical protein
MKAKESGVICVTNACCGEIIKSAATFVPPPFMLKDWERYDVSGIWIRFVAEEGGCLFPLLSTLKHQTVQEDLRRLTATAIFPALFSFSYSSYNAIWIGSAGWRK